MKRNSQLMIVYILIVIICMFAELYIDHPVWWEPLISAVTVSSVFFSFADFANTYSHAQLSMISRAHEYIEENQKKIADERRLIMEIKKKLYLSATPTPFYKQYGKSIESSEKDVVESEEYFNAYSISTSKKQGRAELSEKVSSIFSFLGYLSFFCFAFFSQLTEFFYEFKDRLTVMAFLVVMFSQLINSLALDSVQDEKLIKANVMRSHDNLLRKLYDIREELNQSLDT